MISNELNRNLCAVHVVSMVCWNFGEQRAWLRQPTCWGMPLLPLSSPSPPPLLPLSSPSPPPLLPLSSPSPPPLLPLSLSPFSSPSSPPQISIAFAHLFLDPTVGERLHRDYLQIQNQYVCPVYSRAHPDRARLTFACVSPAAIYKTRQTEVSRLQNTSFLFWKLSTTNDITHKHCLFLYNRI